MAKKKAAAKKPAAPAEPVEPAAPVEAPAPPEPAPTPDPQEEARDHMSNICPELSSVAARAGYSTPAVSYVECLGKRCAKFKGCPASKK